MVFTNSDENNQTNLESKHYVYKKLKDTEKTVNLRSVENKDILNFLFAEHHTHGTMVSNISNERNMN